MRCKCAIAVPIAVVALACIVPCEAKTSASERIRQALKVCNELAANANLADKDAVKEVAPTPEMGMPDMSGLPEERHWTQISANDRIFPTKEQVTLYLAARPWQSDYWLAIEPSSMRNVTEPKSGWPTLADAPGLRVLLNDKDPAIRSLAAEALCTLSQPEDVPRIAALLSDTDDGAVSLEWNQQMSATPFYRPEKFPFDIFRSWRKLSVATYAQRAIWYMTRVKQDADTFREWWRRNDDAEASLWYWQQKIQNATSQVRGQWLIDFGSKPPASGVDPVRELPARQKIAIVKFELELRKLPAEVEAKVKLLAVPTSGPYTRFEEPNVFTPLNIRLKPSRLLELMDRKGLWDDVDWDATLETDRSEGYYYRMLERMARASDELFTAKDVKRLKSVLEIEKSKMPPQCEVEFVMGIARLLPPAQPSQVGDVDTREGFVESQISVEKDEYTRGMLTARLVEIGLPGSWHFVKEEFFRNASLETSGGKRLIVQQLGFAPLTPEKREALLDLILDPRYIPLLKLPGAVMGGDTYRESARYAIRAHIGKDLMTDNEEHALGSSDENVNAFLQKVRGLLQKK